MLKAGVLGAGHLGKIHLRLLQQSEKYELVGFYDPFTENAEKVAAEFGYKLFDSVASLIAAVDMIDIGTPTLSHFDCAKEAILNGCHIFIEKPITKEHYDFLTVENLNNAVVRIVDLNARNVMEATYENLSSQTLTYSVANLSAGTYFLKIQSDKGYITKKFTIVK